MNDEYCSDNYAPKISHVCIEVITVEPITIVGGFFAATGLGLGVGVGARLLRIQAEARRDLKRLGRGREGRSERRFDLEDRPADLFRLNGRKRDSSIIGVYDDVLRHANGDYSSAWEAEMEPTMLAHDQTVEARCDALARTLSVDKPPGTIIQFRFSSGPDSGTSILKHYRARGDGALVHPEASRLHASGLNLHGAAAAANCYRQCALSVWARVPGK